jgi:hypothetical protein
MDYQILTINYWMLVIPVLSALLGWIGIAVAAGILVNKIVPSRKEQLAKQISKAVSDGFSLATIEKKITDPESVRKIMPLVEEHIDDFLRNKLKAKMPVVGMFIGDKTINSLKEVFLKEIEELFPRVLKQFAGNLQKEINIESVVMDKVITVSNAQLKKALSPAVRYFCVAGAITGFLIGTINLLTLYFIAK